MAMITKTLFGTKWIQTHCKTCNKKHFQKFGGRYKEYCSDDCRNYFKYLSALDKTILNINFKDMDSIKSIKSDLFCLVNGLPKKIKEDNHE